MTPGTRSAERDAAVPRRRGVRRAFLPTLLLGFCFGLSACDQSAPIPPPPHPAASQGVLGLRGVTVIDGLGRPPIPDRAILLHDGRILDIVDADVEPDRAETWVDLPGRFVLPGLVDVHAHATVLPRSPDGGLAPSMDRGASEAVLRELLAWGITTARNPAAPAEDGVLLRELVARGEILGPRLLTTGEGLLPNRPRFGPFVAVGSPAEARAEVRRQAALGVDGIKLYAALDPARVEAAIDEAHALDLPVVGHLQRTTWTEAIDLGIDSLTHASPWSRAYLPEELQAGYRGTFRDRLTWIEQLDLTRPAVATLVDRLAVRRIPVDATLIALWTKVRADSPRFRDSVAERRLPAALREVWEGGGFTADWTAEDHRRAERAWPGILAWVRALHEAGVPLTTGSDTPNVGVYPGLSLHQEIELLADAGIPLLEVLRMATHAGAAALGLDDQLGAVRPGLIADLLVLTRDPSQDARDTRSIEWVVVAGRLLRPAEIRAGGALGFGEGVSRRGRPEPDRR